MNKAESDFIKDRLGIKNSTTRVENGITYMDVNGTVTIDHNSLSYIPFTFGVVTGDFTCSSNVLTSLKGAPQIVGGNFICSFNKLTSLEYCPQIIGGNFNAAHNEITSITGCPEVLSKEIGLSGNRLSSLDGIPLTSDLLWVYRNELKPDDFIKLFQMGYMPEQIKADNHCDLMAMFRQWTINKIIE